MKVLFLGLVSLWASTGLEVLPSSKIGSLKQQPCTFLHVWATWCTICVQELPQLLKLLPEMKKVHPVIIDVSSPKTQETFSKKWITVLNPPFKTYLKPPGPDDEYMGKIDSSFSGTLPFSALYDKGTKKRVWVGSLPLPELKKQILTLCK